MLDDNPWWRGAFSTMVLYAVGLHVIWGFSGLSDPSAFDSTGPSAVFRLFGAFSPAVCFSVALLACIAMFCKSPRVVVGLMLPQQSLLIISAVGAARAILLGHFPDGTMRSHEFILNDQAPALLAAATHTLAIFLCAIRVARREA